MGQLVLNFRPLAGGFKCDVEIQFFAYLFLGATAMGKHLELKIQKSVIFEQV